MLPSIMLAAETTTDNLISNGNFSNGLQNWTVEDSTKIKHDNNCYANGTDASGLCKSVRWSSNLGKTISQTIENLEQGYDIEQINLNFTALGCNNEANSSTWCSQGTDYDKVQATIQLSNGANTETLYLEQTLDYNDGTQAYNLSTQTLDTWVTDNTSIDFSITGIDTGNWSGWYAPIVDNIGLSLSLTETVIPEPEVETIVETPVANAIVVAEEENLIAGIDIETSVLNDVILDIPDIPELPTIEIVEVAVIEEIPVAENLPELQTIDMQEPVAAEVNNVPVISNIETIDEIVEIEEIPDVEQTATQDDAEEVVEEPTELVETTMDEDLAEAEENEQKQTNTEKTTKTEKKVTKLAPNKPKLAKKEVGSSDSTPKIKTEIPVAYLQMLVEPITINQAIVLTQGSLYEQNISYITGSYTVDNLGGSNPYSINDMVGVKPKFGGFSEYRKK